MPGITILGLGPGDIGQLTRQAWEVLTEAKEMVVRTKEHPTVRGLPATIKIIPCDDLYETGDTFEQVYEAIVKRVIKLGKRKEGIIYAVPGDPFVAEATSPEIAKRAGENNIPLKIVNGVSFLEPVFAALHLDPYPRLSLVDAIELSEAHIANFPPDVPALIAQIHSRLVAAEVKMSLGTVYPDTHLVHFVHAAGTSEETVESIPLYEIDRSAHIGLMSALFVPPLEPGTSFESFQEIVAHLRAPDGCPWDKEQTHQSLRPHLMEEAYEVLSALDSGDGEKMKEELGDLLLQIVLNAHIGSEEGEFGMADILKGIQDKLVRRHPHVFGGMQVKNVQGVLKNWEKIKAEERKLAKEKKGIMDGVPLALPALAQAQEYQDRAARVGFDWSDVSGVLDKVAEEIREFQAASDAHELGRELGDLFFSLVNLARWKQIDSESALRATNQRFKERFSYIEKHAQQKGKKLTDMNIDEMELLWQKAKGR